MRIEVTQANEYGLHGEGEVWVHAIGFPARPALPRVREMLDASDCALLAGCEPEPFDHYRAEVGSDLRETDDPALYEDWWIFRKVTR